MSDEWIEQLKPGDKVIVDGHYYGDSIRTVERITKTLIVLDNNTRFNKRGFQTGCSAYSGGMIRKYSEERAAKIIHATRCQKLHNMEWKSLPPDVIASVWKLVQEALVQNNPKQEGK